MTDIERVRELCKQKGISPHKLEVSLGFSNGYLNPKKAKTISYDRMMKIAAFLNVPISQIMYGGETQKSPAPISEGEVDVDRDELIRILSVLNPSEREQLLAHGRTLVIAHAAQGNGPKSP